MTNPNWIRERTTGDNSFMSVQSFQQVKMARKLVLACAASQLDYCFGANVMRSIVARSRNRYELLLMHARTI
jgi:hypothetical protein